jgi:hypothetical protein
MSISDVKTSGTVTRLIGLLNPQMISYYTDEHYPHMRQVQIPEE